MIVADYVAHFLAEQKVTHVFELSGGMIAPLLDSIAKAGAPTLIDMRHEQAAGFAAEGFARMTGVPGVALATSGPGAVNLLTAIGSCYFDSVPAVFITGNVRTDEARPEGGGQRQRGFQETDIVAMAKPITKWAAQVKKPEGVPVALTQAFRIAKDGRPGPVLVDLPFDVQRAEVSIGADWKRCPRLFPPLPLDVLDGVLAAFQQAERPLILVGGGIRAAGAVLAARAMIDRLGVPVVSSLMGLDVLAPNHPYRVGMIGSYGNRWANWALAQADVVLVLGSRLDVRQTGADVEAFIGAKTAILQVDVDEGEINQRVPVTAIRSDVGAFCGKLAMVADRIDRPAWREAIEEKRRAWPAESEHGPMPPLNPVNPNALMEQLGQMMPDASAFVVDVGAHQMWAAQSLAFREGQRVLFSGGMGAMGFALPAAIGAALAMPGRPVVVIAGDGGLQINIQELATIRERNLPIKIVVLNNRGAGMVRQFQAEVFGGRFVGTFAEAPSFCGVASAYGFTAIGGIGHPDDVPKALDWISNVTGPALLEVMISPTAKVVPKLVYGSPLDEMSPPRS